MIAFVFCYFRYGGEGILDVSFCFNCLISAFFGLVVVFGYLVHLYSMVWF